jgi:hypothetical protein
MVLEERRVQDGKKAASQLRFYRSDALARRRRRKQAGESIWAYLPVGPLERPLREGIQGGSSEKRFRRTLKRELFPCFGGKSWGSLC